MCNQDSRLSDGYENVPTRDIHMKQVGLDLHWLYVLQSYVRPLQELVFLGYYHDVRFLLTLLFFLVFSRTPASKMATRPCRPATYT